MLMAFLITKAKPFQIEEIMNKVEFFRDAQPLLQRAAELANTTKMSNKERATKTIELQQDEMKFFAKALQDDLMGNKVDLLA